MITHVPASVIVFRARSNCLDLRDRKRYIGVDTKCIICEAETENLEHFLLDCSGYSEIRTSTNKLQQPYKENRNEIIGNLLFELDNKEEVDQTKEMIYRMWKTRKKIEKNITS